MEHSDDAQDPEDLAGLEARLDEGEDRDDAERLALLEAAHSLLESELDRTETESGGS